MSDDTALILKGQASLTDSDRERLFVHLDATAQWTSHGGGDAWLEWDERRGVPMSEKVAPGRVPLERVSSDDYNARGWWQTLASYEAGTDVAPPDRVIFQPPPEKLVTCYRLAESFAHVMGERYPETLTHSDFLARYDDGDGDPTITTMYEAEHEQRSREPIIADKIIRLDGTPPPKDGRRYTAKLPYALQARTEYVHLFPGQLHGFTETAAAALKERGHDFYHHGEHNLFAKANGQIAWSGSYRISDTVEGEDRADAARQWDIRLASLLADVDAKIKLCPSCGRPLPEPKPTRARRGRRR